jgi:hypothetical protein
MRAFLLGAVAAVALALCMAPQQASAYWATRTTYKWDPYCCRYVPCTERYWVPDCYDRCEPYDPCYRDGYGRRDGHDSYYRGGYDRYGDEVFSRREPGRVYPPRR